MAHGGSMILHLRLFRLFALFYKTYKSPTNKPTTGRCSTRAELTKDPRSERCARAQTFFFGGGMEHKLETTKVVSVLLGTLDNKCVTHDDWVSFLSL